MISSKIIHPYKIKVSKKKQKKQQKTQKEQIKPKKNVSVHPDIELEKTSHHLGFGYKACLHFYPPSCFMFVFQRFFFFVFFKFFNY